MTSLSGPLGFQECLTCTWTLLFIYSSTFFSGSHITDLLQPFAASILWQGEADVASFLPATADHSESSGHAGHDESQATQQNYERKDQDQYKGGRQVERVLGWVEGTVPAK